jgi:hypothetical protein
MNTKTSASLIKAYNLVAEAHNPNHPLLLKAVSNLIDELIEIKEYHDALRYARMNYEQLTQPVDTESLDVSNAAEYLAEVVSMLFAHYGPDSFDILEAEILSRKAILIKERIYGHNHMFTIRNLSTLSQILLLKEDHYEERKDLLERCLAINMQNDRDSDDIAIGNQKLAMFHFKIAAKISSASIARTEKLLVAQSYSKEAVRISNEIFGANHSTTITFKAALSKILELINQE